jgi:hypothetical protein
MSCELELFPMKKNPHERLRSLEDPINHFTISNRARAAAAMTRKRPSITSRRPLVPLVLQQQLLLENTKPDSLTGAKCTKLFKIELTPYSQIDQMQQVLFFYHTNKIHRRIFF